VTVKRGGSAAPAASEPDFDALVDDLPDGARAVRQLSESGQTSTAILSGSAGLHRGTAWVLI